MRRAGLPAAEAHEICGAFFSKACARPVNLDRIAVDRNDLPSRRKRHDRADAVASFEGFCSFRRHSRFALARLAVHRVVHVGNLTLVQTSVQEKRETPPSLFSEYLREGYVFHLGPADGTEPGRNRLGICQRMPALAALASVPDLQDLEISFLLVNHSLPGPLERLNARSILRDGRLLEMLVGTSDPVGISSKGSNELVIRLIVGTVQNLDEPGRGVLGICRGFADLVGETGLLTNQGENRLASKRESFEVFRGEVCSVGHVSP